MSDQLTYIHETPELVWGGTEDADIFPIIDISDGYRIKHVTQDNLRKIVLSGKEIGGTGLNDIADNSSAQTWRKKTLLDPVIQVTPPGGGDVEIIDEETLYKLNAMIGTLSDAGYEDGAKLVENVDNIPRQTFCAITEKESTDPGKLVTLTAANLFAYSGLDDTNREIDVRSLLISVWLLDNGAYTQKLDWTASASVTSGTALDTLAITMHDAGTMYAISVHFRLVQ